MASQEFLASFAVEIDESGVSRLQQVREENWDLTKGCARAGGAEAGRNITANVQK